MYTRVAMYPCAMYPLDVSFLLGPHRDRVNIGGLSEVIKKLRN